MRYRNQFVYHGLNMLVAFKILVVFLLNDIVHCYFFKSEKSYKNVKSSGNWHSKQIEIKGNESDERNLILTSNVWSIHPFFVEKICCVKFNAIASNNFKNAF